MNGAIAGHQLTRGYGVLENFLSRRRSRMADKLILAHLRKGRILDIGCGTTPYFLLHTSFHQKYGLDPSTKIDLSPFNVTIQSAYIEKNGILPYDNCFFDVITSLGVIGHFDTDTFNCLLKEIYRMLKPGGQLILTTPFPGCQRLLKFMARWRLVSPQEIGQRSYHLDTLKEFLVKANFEEYNIRTGLFEFFLNSWTTALRAR